MPMTVTWKAMESVFLSIAKFISTLTVPGFPGFKPQATPDRPGPVRNSGRAYLPLSASRRQPPCNRIGAKA